MKKGVVLFAMVVIFFSTVSARAASLEALEKQVEELSGQLKALQATNTPQATPSGEGLLAKAFDRISLGGYGEFDYIFKRENGNGKGGNTFDPHRFVLYVNSELSESISLKSELEWEHGGASSKKNGEVAIEQAYLDFEISRPLNAKAGILLVPVGGVNLYHEPTIFNSTERPELDRFLIPSTWREMGAGLYGSLGDKVDYQLLVMNGLDGTKFSAADGIRKGRQDVDSDVNRNKAVSGRLEVRPATNLYTNFSFYTANSAPSGKPTAYTTLLAVDGKYSVGIFDVAGEYVHIYQDKPEVLSDEIGHNMSGYWIEGACHLMPKGWRTGRLSDSDLLAFARWSEFDTQQGKIADPAKKSGRYDRNYTTVGLVFKPVETVAIKADYQLYGDDRGDGEKALDNDKFQITLGYVF